MRQMKRIKAFTLLSIFGMTLAISPFLIDLKEDNKIAAPGLVAYAASYDRNITSEPNYNSQNSYSFSCMNFKLAPTSYRGESVKLAIIDSGLNYNHEDFTNNGVSVINGYSKYYGYDYDNSRWTIYQYSSGHQSKLDDSLGHGTNVAACAASLINGVGGAGIAPNVDLYIYKVTNAKNGYEFGATQLALEDCISKGVKVINMSFQSYEHEVTYNGYTMGASTNCSTILTYYLNRCYNNDIVLVAAAGNYNTSEPSYPASNNHVISVGSLAESSTTSKADYSNTYGIDLVAPGTVYVADKGASNSYKKTQGTSFSSPLVAGAIALYRQKYPSATVSEVEEALYSSCDSIPGNPSWAGHGRLNVDRFLGLESYSDGVTDITLDNVSGDSISLEVGDTFDLEWTVNGTGTYSTEVDYELYMDDGTISFENGRITALKEGSEILTLTSVENPNVSIELMIEVTAPVVQKKLTSISLNGQTTLYEVNKAFSFTGNCIAHYDDGSQNNVLPTSISSPNMSTRGVKTITVTYTENGVSKSVTYEIVVNSYRTVMEGESTESVIGTVNYSTNKQVLSSGVTVETGGYTTIENNSIRLGSGSNTGYVTVKYSSTSINKVVVKAKSYGSDTGVSLKIGGTSKTITSSYSNYEVSFANPVSSVKIETTANKKRANIELVTLYSGSTSVDIGRGEDCVGIETFITRYLHMDYTQNLGYCKDNEHHYYATAKEAFNLLNNHQRVILSTNSAYSSEWARLNAWARANGESINNSNLLASNKNTFDIEENLSMFYLIGAILIISSGVVLTYFIKNKKRI